MDKFNELKTLIANLEEEAMKFYTKQNKTAGLRLRKGLQEVKTLAQEIRLNVSETKKTL